MINIRDFGAVGDGITLDTAAVQKALDCCKKNGGTVVVPGGKTYKRRKRCIDLWFTGWTYRRNYIKRCFC